MVPAMEVTSWSVLLGSHQGPCYGVPVPAMGVMVPAMEVTDPAIGSCPLVWGQGPCYEGHGPCCGFTVPARVYYTCFGNHGPRLPATGSWSLLWHTYCHITTTSAHIITTAYF